jgi:hypothetical protein
MIKCSIKVVGDRRQATGVRNSEFESPAPRLTTFLGIGRQASGVGQRASGVGKGAHNFVRIGGLSPHACCLTPEALL